MKKTLYLSFVILSGLSACARPQYVVKTAPPPPSRVIVLPEIEKGKIPKSYVINGKRYYPLPDSHGFVQYGKASWYGKKFHGRPTANGEIFDMHAKSAAHKTLPLATLVKVINLSNKKYTIVRVNDRGPFVKGRIIDLSYAAAKEIDLVGPGLADVKIVALGKETGTLKAEGTSRPLVELPDFKRGEFTIQVAAFESKRNALRLAQRLKVIYQYVNVSVYVDEEKKTLYRVHVSKSNTLSDAGEIEKSLEDMGFMDAFIVRI
ncbi:MAG: septal ring lytic transglycosylase RlpA family protein [Desulfobacteraceae bacterium]|jgi:rare lipoprotein A